MYTFTGSWVRRADVMKMVFLQSLALTHTIVCFVGLFHIGNWNFWLVMAQFPGLSYVSILVLRCVNNMCFELVYLLCTINSAECHCVSEDGS